MRDLYRLLEESRVEVLQGLSLVDGLSPGAFGLRFRLLLIGVSGFFVTEP